MYSSDQRHGIETEENKAAPAANFISRPVRRWHSTALGKTASGIFIFLTVVIGARALQHSLKPVRATGNPLAYDPVTLEPKRPAGLLSKITQYVLSDDDALVGEREDRINILLLGIGGAGHDGAYLTDTIILLSFKPSTREVAMISIPRDLAVKIPGKGVYKINSASAFGEAERPGWGGAKTSEVVEKTLDIRIPYYARIDFSAFKDTIDAIGGIAVNVERSFTDAMYPGPENSYRTVSFTRGRQIMDGETALEYARSRHGSNGEGSDFARARRQQNMLIALKQKFMSAGVLANPLKINHVIQSLEAHMTTNMAFRDLLAVTRLARAFRLDDIKTLVLDTGETGYLTEETGPDGAFLLAPKAGDFSEIRSAIRSIFSNRTSAIGLQRSDFSDRTSGNDRSPKSDSRGLNIGIEIQNGTWRAGLAARLKKRLEEKSISAETLGNAPVRPVAESGVYPVTPRAYAEALAVIAETLHIPARAALDHRFTPLGNPDILIILGEDLKE